ncbi:MAG TPA: bifunctional UDP-N-acetylmuramoyl-tripeptide:D-alanyl-D-alanine ligase/alanine racemase [Ferruginibacter sp.]|nr:bifunctional UDP-N-acetylmuramoyl-tripeptide:D-alanyl-D-alanine ligase/alanine racemase [Ferruginibacter sp.]
MFTARFSQIGQILQTKPLQMHGDTEVQIPLTDSRKLLFPEKTIFFALSTSQKNANEFIVPLYNKGVRCFISNHFTQTELENCSDANFLQVPDVLAALQQLATVHRQSFHYPVLGITGSNGKTIVKEWLFQLLNDSFNIVRSPKSYNSQIGVPLSLWQMGRANNLAIIEAGISQAGEMERLEKMIKPDIGVFTFLGNAHNEGFINQQKKAFEKLLLFKNSKCLVYCSDEESLNEAVQQFYKTYTVPVFTWGQKGNPTLKVLHLKSDDKNSNVKLEYKSNSFELIIPFTDEASVHNAITCCALMLYFNIPVIKIQEGLLHLKPVAMRLELKQGINQCSIINDSYSADINSLTIALDFLQQQQQHSRHSLILSDLLETGQSQAELYQKIASIVAQKKLYRFIGIGEQLMQHRHLFNSAEKQHFYSNTADFISQLPQVGFNNETILLKAARIFRFEKISRLLEQKQHQTFLEINLNALRHNVRAYKNLLAPGVKMMAMVKAFSYGSGSFEIAGLLQHTGVDYLGVAYADEGVELRKAGIQLPIMVMNTEEAGFESIVQYRLEPELYSFRILQSFINFLQQNNLQYYPVHIKYDTGMHRLGFEPNDLDKLCNELKATTNIRVVSFFSHLAASGDAKQDNFTKQQGNLLIAAAKKVEAALEYPIVKHIANTSAIHRHQNLQLDMVRLGIGMYGVDEDEFMQQQLQNVTTLKTTISQIKNIKAGESIGYSRSAVAPKDMKIATIRIGYADGYPRILSNGKGQMLLNGQLAPIVGKVCMDMTMIDITDIPAEEEDEVIVFGEQLSVNKLAQWAQTIPYEILTNISQRVKRLYFEE